MLLRYASWVTALDDPHAMMAGMAEERPGAASAAADFLRERRRADVRAVLAQLSGQHRPLLSYDEVRQRLHGVESAATKLEDVPLGAIVGSVGRYQDFTREFLPRSDADRNRWVGVKLAMTGLEGVPPVELYRIGDAYFVKDGNHRVSVARQLGAKSIQAYVTPVHARVGLSPDDDPDDLIIKAEYAAFLEETGLDTLRPHADLRVTVPGRYEALLEHVHVHQYFMGIDFGREVSLEEAAAHWYDVVYLPVVHAIRGHGLLKGFPGRTETDLYLFLAEHRANLERAFGWRLDSETVASGIGEPQALDPDERADELLDAAAVELGRRRERVRLVHDLLVLLSGRSSDAEALQTALQLASFERARLYALRVHVADLEPSDLEDERTRFGVRCEEAGVRGQIAFTDGEPLQLVRERAAYVDLVVAALAEGEGEGRHLVSELRGLMRRCPRPLVVPPKEPSSVSRPLLAFDGGPRSEAALFAIAYAALKRGSEPVVLNVPEFGRGDAPRERARAYLERLGIQATYLSRRGAVPDAIEEVVRQEGCDALFMGAYKYSRWWEEQVGGVLDQVLLRCRVPLFIT